MTYVDAFPVISDSVASYGIVARSIGIDSMVPVSINIVICDRVVVS